MITNYVFDNFFLFQSAVFGLQLLLFFYQFSWNSFFREERRHTIQRIGAYAALSFVGTVKPNPRQLLSKEGHQILLGTLKKVEQKNASILTLLVLMLSIFFAIAYGDGEYTPYGAFLVIVASSLIFPVWFTIRGMRQLDSSDLIGHKFENTEALGQKLQNDLVDDLVKKERCFRASYISLRATLLGFLLVIVFEGWIEISSATGASPTNECCCCQILN